MTPEPGEGPLAKRATGLDRAAGPALLVSLALLVAGLLLPAITIRSFGFARDYSLLDSVLGFLDQGDWFLFAVVALFSIAFPLGKIATGLTFWYLLDGAHPAAPRLLDGLSALSKYSMLDVFIVALVVLVADGRLLTSADIGIGTIVFSLAVLLSTWAIWRLAGLAKIVS